MEQILTHLVFETARRRERITVEGSAAGRVRRSGDSPSGEWANPPPRRPTSWPVCTPLWSPLSRFRSDADNRDAKATDGWRNGDQPHRGKQNTHPGPSREIADFATNLGAPSVFRPEVGLAPTLRLLSG